MLNDQKINNIDTNLINDKSPGVRTFFIQILNKANLDNNILKKL